MENPLSVCGKFQNFSFFPSFNAYETVDGFETSCEKPVASQHSLHVRDETMKSYLLVSLPSTTFTMLRRLELNSLKDRNTFVISEESSKYS